MRIVVTGGTGHLGRSVVQTALRQGHQVTLLGPAQALPGTQRAIPWRLGEPVPDTVWDEPCDAAIHLAHVWHAPGMEEDDINVRGTSILLASARRAAVGRFVFASSLSARTDALNQYGRVKYRIESLLAGDSETAARIGLLYGGARRSLWATLIRITAWPVLPVTGAGQTVQPIHVDDAAHGLLRLAVARGSPRTVLAGEPIAFGEFLGHVAQARHGRQPLFLPVPLPAVLWPLTAFDKIGLPVRALRERVLGLAGVTVRPGAADAARLGLTLRTLDAGLAPGRWKPARAQEAAAYLRYILNGPVRGHTLRRYLRGWRRYGFGAPALPQPFTACPPLLRIAEPLPNDHRPRAAAVRARLLAAAVLAEAEPDFSRRFYAAAPRHPVIAALRMLVIGTLEAALLVPRAAIGLWLWR